MIRFKNKRVWIFPLLALGAGIVFFWQGSGWTVETTDQSANIKNDEEEKGNISPISGIVCDNYSRRPLAVVIASDPVARPLTGLSQADWVFEMPVITGSITRMMAIFQCNSPEEIGSLRSARHDFIPLAAGFDAILVHWGGSHFALDKLNAGVMDNIDALKNPSNAFYRKSGVPQPHDGFTSMSRLTNAAEKLGYQMGSDFKGYSFTDDKSQMNREKILRIGYTYPYNVSYRYEPESNSYLRYRTNLEEIDQSDNKQIKAKNVVVMRVVSKQIEEPDYNDLDLEGSGACQVYQNGVAIDCVWQKSEKNPVSKLEFLDRNNQEVPFVPGQTWIEIVEPGQEITWR